MEEQALDRTDGAWRGRFERLRIECGESVFVAPECMLVLSPAIGEVEDRARQGLARQLARGLNAIGLPRLGG